MNKNEKILLGAACFFAGAVTGFLISPIKKGIYCGNNSGNKYNDKNESVESLDEIDKVLDEVNQVINNVSKGEDEEVLDSEGV